MGWLDRQSDQTQTLCCKEQFLYKEFDAHKHPYLISFYLFGEREQISSNAVGLLPNLHH